MTMLVEWVVQAVVTASSQRMVEGRRAVAARPADQNDAAGPRVVKEAPRGLVGPSQPPFAIPLWMAVAAGLLAVVEAVQVGREAAAACL